MQLIPHFRGRPLFQPKSELPIIGLARMAMMASAALIVVSLIAWSTIGLNYGVDFKGGSMIEVQAKSGQADIAGLRNVVGDLGLGDVQIQQFGKPSDVLIRIEQQPGGEKAQQAALGKVLEAIGNTYEQRRAEVVGPAVSGELRITGMIAVLCSILAIILYVWFRFEWQFAVGAVVALTHDVLITVGVFSILQLEFDLSTVAALLTILGYSVNDTVVVSDRIRENLRKFKKLEINALLNRSINETLARTLMTSLTTLTVLVALYILGGEVIRNFTFAMMFGVIIGTYSSIFIAAPLLARLGVKRDWSGVTRGAPAAAN
ncbi:MAG: protein translocase subunit SecF [Pseudomonadota bacterium]